jgi:hypothetical protein
MCRNDSDYRVEPIPVNDNNINSDTNEVVSIPAFTIINPVKELYERLIDKEVQIYDLFTDKDSVFVTGTLKEVIISSTNETVYLRLEYLADSVIKNMIICVGEGTSVIEV